MISGLVLILTWFFLTSFFLKQSSIPRRIVPAISFAASQAVLFFIYFSLIFLGNSQYAKNILLAGIFAGIVNLFLRPSSAKNAWHEIQSFILSKQAYEESTTLNHTWAAYIRNTSNTRIFVTVSASIAILATSMLIASPSSWDAYTYNLSRIGHMIIRGSPLLTNSPSLPQALFPLGHDLLYYPDILFGNLKGLGVINSLEFSMILGVSLALCDLLLTKLATSPYKLQCILETAKMISVGLIISSDQQVLQSISVKNDLVITLFFLSACQIGLTYLRQPTDFTELSYIIVAIFLTLFSYVCKAYGLICAVPFTLALVGRWISRHEAPQAVLNKEEPWHNQRNLNKNPSIFIGILSILLLIFTLYFSRFVSVNYAHLSEYKISAANLINKFPDVGSYIAAAFINAARYVINFVAYPYSTILKSPNLSKDDYLLGLAPIVKTLSMNNFAILTGYAYGLIRYRNEDVSMTSPLVQLTFISTIASLVVVRLVSSVKVYMPLLKQVISLKGLLFLMIAAFGGSFLIFTFLAYHNWYGKYIGFFYLTLIPVSAWVLSFNLFFIAENLQYSVGHFKVVRATAILRRLFVIVAGIFLFYSLSTNSRLFALPFLVKGRDQYKVYYEYLNAMGYENPSDKARFLSLLSPARGQTVTLCFGEETPSLVPFLELLRNNVNSKQLFVASPDDAVCKSAGQTSGDHRIISLP